ncbi:DUF2249 domain-containing protein [Microaerobacter geothermalis]|uniref:DUF2249 domain-containing protein n=1 Tax=Microaerobacter geothermalis TaxID=674972 RepID=UPI001F344512|nr:DUF2249 domain-containing protein [Microaerobacter geothermalis]MCF6094261.1 DUF2249 domain-containing protein [Microaerobacter geothermalis]
MAEIQFAARVDAREYEPRDKHRVIFETFDALEVGTTMELLNDHDPRPLQYQFMMEREGAFSWEYLEQGPEVWRVAIGKVK